jgi:transcriptional regulator with XRE-family HTH domain
MHSYQHCKYASVLFLSLESSLMKELKERLKTARKKIGKTQAQVAKEAEMAQPPYAQLEGGQSKTTAHVCRLAKSLNVDPYWLETGKGSPDAITALEDAEKRLITLYRQLTAEQKAKAEGYAEALLEQKLKPDKPAGKQNTRVA